MNKSPHFQYFLLALGILLSSAVNVYAEDNKTTVSISEEIVRELGKSYQGLESFKAEYELSGKKKAGEATIVTKH